MTTAYQKLLEQKRLTAQPSGKDIPRDAIHPALFPHQRDVVQWGVRAGRCAFFLDTGLGKTLAQVEWARQIDLPTLIIAPLSVAPQTIAEAKKRLNQPTQYVRSPQETDTNRSARILITNYENAHKFEPSRHPAVILDESSVLKSLDSKMRLQLTEQWKDAPYKLCCTATPAPNDLKEIVNHADFLGVMTRKETFATFFINEQGKNGSLNTRLKRHAVKPFYRWLASWAVAICKPSDLGYSDDGFALPELTINTHTVESNYQPDGQLFVVKLGGVTERAAVRRATEQARIALAVQRTNHHAPKQVIVWHQTNAEGYALEQALGEQAVLVEGAHSAEDKERRFTQFISGEKRVLITKPRIAGFGMNFQHSSRAVVMSVNDSYEEFYQLVRRQYRYGQQDTVEVDVIIADVQQTVWENVQRKSQEAEQLSANLVAHMNVHQKQIRQPENRQRDEDYQTGEASGENWRLLLGDSCERLAEIETGSVGLSVHSPPFVNRYAYTATERDLGNSNGLDEFMQHYRHIIRELYRVTMSGRNACVHLQQVRQTKRDTGAVQLLDFRGPVIETFRAEGWVYYQEITVDKDAQMQAKRKHHTALMFKTLNSDSAKLGGALADYLLVFRKSGDNPQAVSANITEIEWIQYARPAWWDGVSGRDRVAKLKSMSKAQLLEYIQCNMPVWYDINEIDVLDTQVAKADDDEMHLAPLQLEFIERCIKIWSNKGDIVLDPFSGVGSTAYVAYKNGRQGLGIELKPEYHATAIKNLQRAEVESQQMTLWDMAVPV